LAIWVHMCIAWPEPYILTVYDRMYGHFSASSFKYYIYIVHTSY
jgi:hypothetical protein